MSSESIRQSAADLVWSLWTELGVPGVVRNHATTVVDVEPLLIVTPGLAGDDSRLLEQVLGWCVINGDRVNTSRLTKLLSSLPRAASTAFEGFAATVNSVAGTKWPATGTPWSPLPRLRDVPIQFGRPSLLRLRTRALCGVGTRADVLCELAARHQHWTSAAEIAEGGHSKRNVARVLADFTSSDMAIQTEAGNTLRFRLANPPALAGVLGEWAPATPDWMRIFGLALRLVEFAVMPEVPIRVGRVRANTARDELAPLAAALRLDTPPTTSGNPNAVGDFTEWATDQIGRLANGTSPALRSPAADDLARRVPARRRA